MNQRIIYLIVICLIMDTFYVQAYRCPDIPENGEKWDTDDKGGQRCILRCKEGYSPSGCHVLRKEIGEWNYAIPQCVSDLFLNILLYWADSDCAAPQFLSLLGFGPDGVVAGSLAAWLQPSIIAKGSWFSMMQRAGAKGIPIDAKSCADGSRNIKESLSKIYCDKE